MPRKAPPDKARSSPGAPFHYEFNARQAAEYLGRNLDFIYRAVEQRRIAHSRVGRELRFSQYDLDKYLHANRVEAVDPYNRKVTA